MLFVIWQIFTIFHALVGKFCATFIVSLDPFDRWYLIFSRNYCNLLQISAKSVISSMMWFSRNIEMKSFIISFVYWNIPITLISVAYFNLFAISIFVRFPRAFLFSSAMAEKRFSRTPNSLIFCSLWMGNDVYEIVTLVNITLLLILRESFHRLSSEITQILCKIWLYISHPHFAILSYIVLFSRIFLLVLCFSWICSSLWWLWIHSSSFAIYWNSGILS